MSGIDWTNTRKRRDRLHIMAEVLEVTRNGALKTQIMYKANLSFAQLNEYLSVLLELDLLKVNKRDQTRVYKTTRKGIEYLRSYQEIRALLEKEEKDVKRNPLVYLTKPDW